MLLVDIEGTTLFPVEVPMLQHPIVAGVILFARNFQNINQLKHLISDIREKSNKDNFLVTVDHEGGRVQRFLEGFTQFVPAGELSELFHKNPAEALQQSYVRGSTIARELTQCGIDLCFAPVLDLDGVCPIISKRAFAADKNIVVALGRAFINGLNDHGMAAVGKHFPGHGNVKEDSHIDMAVDNRKLSQIMQYDVEPFRVLANNLEAIMVSHVVYKEVNSDSASCSGFWLQEILRKELKYKGLIISDCFSMQGVSVSGPLDKKIKTAFDAGCELVIISQQSREIMFELLDKLKLDPAALDFERLKLVQADFSKVELQHTV